MEILQKVGELFLQAVPTAIIVFLFYLYMRWAFFGPMLRAIAERRARIEGARAEAAAAEGAARQELDAYGEALRKAKGEIYAEQETARQAVLDERVKLLKALRQRAQEEVEAAKRTIAAEVATARTQIELETPELAAVIARSILKGSSPARGEASQ